MSEKEEIILPPAPKFARCEKCGQLFMMLSAPFTLGFCSFCNHEQTLIPIN